MKHKDEKYKEAVERNMKHLKMNVTRVLDSVKKEENRLSALKIKLGIRETDETHDSVLNTALKA